MNIDDWLRQVEPYYLTIQHIQDMKPGETQKFLCIDRNFYDCIPTLTEENAIDIDVFFKDCYMIEYTHTFELTGTAIWSYNKSNKANKKFEFEIEYAKNKWYPLKNGNLPAEDPQGIFKELAHHDVKRNWKEYDKTTHIGWRGQMIPWNIIKNQNWPKIYNC
jgi:hypothetical protein